MKRIIKTWWKWIWAIWWIITLFGIILLCFPTITLTIITTIIAIILLIAWTWTLLLSVRNWWFLLRWWWIISSVIDIIIAIEILNSPESSAITIMSIFVWILAIWLIVKWITEVKKSLKLKKWYQKWYCNQIAWIIMVIIWIFVIATPTTWIFTLTTILALICISYWIYFISLSLQLTKSKQINEKLDWKDVINMD